MAVLTLASLPLAQQTAVLRIAAWPEASKGYVIEDAPGLEPLTVKVTTGATAKTKRVHFVSATGRIHSTPT